MGLFSFSALIDESGFYLGLLLMLIGFLLSAKQNLASVRTAPIVWLSMGICLYVLAGAFFNTPALIPNLSFAEKLRSSGDLIAISGIFSVLLAWALQLDARNPRRALTLFLAGYLLALALGADWRDLSSYLAGRPLFGLGSGFGIYTLSVLIGLFIVGSTELQKTGHQRARLPVLLGTLGLFTFLLALFMVGQMRGSWMAALLVLPAVAYAMHRHRPVSNVSKRALLLLICVPLACLFVVYASFDTIAARATEEWDILLNYLSRGASELRPASGSYRIWLWEDAVARIQQRPVFGWGPNTSPLMVAESEVYGFLSHFHNLYLQLTVEIGIVGLVLFGVWLTLAGNGLAQAYREHALSFSMLLLIAALSAAFAIVSLVQYRPSEAGQFFMIFVGGLALSYQLKCRDPQ